MNKKANWMKSDSISRKKAERNDRKQVPKKTINILLLGETGVGKSTFINAFANYLKFDTLDQAENAETIPLLIPTNFTIVDKNFEAQRVQFGSDSNESEISGASGTQSTKCHIVESGDLIIRFIDTPGVGDTHGIRKDEENFDALMSVIGELEDIHGICVLLKPNNPRSNVLFEYCITQLVGRLQNNISRNIVFVFTHSRGTFFRPGETLIPLEKLLRKFKEKPPYLDIPFGKENTFCLDNEAFKFLIARKSNIQFGNEEEQILSESWTISLEVCSQLIAYIKTLKPYKVKESASVNEVDRLIRRLSIPLAEITYFTMKNIYWNECYITKLNDNLKGSELKRYLNKPRIGLKLIPLKHPVTVCSNQKCIRLDKKKNITHLKYKRKCYRQTVEDDRPFGGFKLMAFEDDTDRRKCNNLLCRHPFQDHVYIYYKSNLEKYSLAKKFKQNKIDKKHIHDKIVELNTINCKYQIEMRTIKESVITFNYFLKYNRISFNFSSVYKEYIAYLIDREKKMGDGRHMRNIEFDVQQSLHGIVGDQQVVISVSDVIQLVQALRNLEFTGAIIKKFCSSQEDLIRTEFGNSSSSGVK